MRRPSFIQVCGTEEPGMFKHLARQDGDDGQQQQPREPGLWHHAFLSTPTNTDTPGVALCT